ncbi:MAG: peptidylprolyl isomerase [bacterium]|nr:peptidylprolyl isomerase [bacterium]
MAWGRKGSLAAPVFCCLWVGSAWLSGCTEPESSVVAVVGARTISTPELVAFIQGLPEDARHEGEGEARIHLQTLIDMELLLMEARTRRFDASPAFLSRMTKARHDKLISMFEERTIEVVVSDSAVTANIAAHHLDRAVRVADIMIPDLATAQKVLREIHNGADFAQVARKWSANRQTAPQGGDIGRYVSRYDLIPILSEKLAQLPVGSVSEPIRIGQGYSVFKVLSETTFELKAEQRRKVAEELHGSRYQAARAELVDELKQNYGLQPDTDGLAIFYDALKRGESAAPEDPLATVIFRFDGGVILGSDAIDAFQTIKGDPLSTVGDVGQLQKLLERHVVPKAMLLEAAKRAGIAEEPAIADWLTEQARQLLIMGLRASVLQETAPLSDADVKQYYEDNKERFLHPEQTEVQEVLTETLSEAQHLRQMIEEEGADLGDLARKHSIRSLDIRDNDGRFHLHRHEAAEFGGFVEHAADAEIGKLMGPVQVHEGYSVFRVLSRSRKQETFEEAKWRAKSILRRKTQQKIFDEFMQEVRERYDSQVKIFDGAVDQVDTSLL